MSRRSRWEYFKAVYARYQQAERQSKHVILNEFCLNTGYHRKYAILSFAKTESAVKYLLVDALLFHRPPE